jgi:hypothetical protein
MSQLAPFVCVRCRASFRRPYEKGIDYKPCALCGQEAVRADIRFRTPRKSDDKQWKKVEFLFQHGFYFQKVYRLISQGMHLRVRYPRDLAEARGLVAEFKAQAIKPYYCARPTAVRPQVSCSSVSPAVAGAKRCRST